MPWRPKFLHAKQAVAIGHTDDPGARELLTKQEFVRALRHHEARRERDRDRKDAGDNFRAMHPKISGYPLRWSYDREQEIIWKRQIKEKSIPSVKTLNQALLGDPLEGRSALERGKTWHSIETGLNSQEISLPTLKSDTRKPESR